MPDVQDFDEINVQRINLREPDGRLRYVLANSTRLPGAIIRGEEFRPHRSEAGMIFYSDEETENGGLVFAGKDGESGGALSFDAYEQDQVVQIIGHTAGSSMTAGMVVNEVPDRPMDEQIREIEKLRQQPDGDQVIEQMQAAGAFGHRRMFAGVKDGDAVLDLRDDQGRSRLRLTVAADGTAAIEFLGEDGQVLTRLTPSAADGADDTGSAR